MARICYKEKRFGRDAMAKIIAANQILDEYREKGFDLTLRQLYYQFVSKDYIANNHREYKNLGSVINDARMAGLIDWDMIVDRTRELRGRQQWESPSAIISAAANGFGIDLWEGQGIRPEVWIEKDALVGVIEKVCRSLDVSYFSCRGYVSQSEMHEAAASRIIPRAQQGQGTVILHLGDHDPSGLDMTRDIEDRLGVFGCEKVLKVIRIALTMEQVRRYKPPPNPAKLTDVRSTEYVKAHGDESWELDALSPETIAKLITDNVKIARDEKPYAKRVKLEKDMKASLLKTSKHWDDVATYVKSLT